MSSIDCKALHEETIASRHAPGDVERAIPEQERFACPSTPRRGHHQPEEAQASLEDVVEAWNECTRSLRPAGGPSWGDPADLVSQLIEDQPYESNRATEARTQDRADRSARREASILVVDDEHPVRDLLRRHLTRLGYSVNVAADARQALDCIISRPIDLVLSDIRMPGMDGMRLLRGIRTIDSALPVIMITAVSETATAIQALRLGAADYVLKPFDLDGVTISLDRAIERRRMERQLETYRLRLEELVKIRTAELEVARKQAEHRLTELVDSLTCALEAKDSYTEGHSRRVAWCALRIGIELGLDRSELEELRLTALLHDVGKIGVPEEILSKPGRLTPEEMELVHEHVLVGARIAARANGLDSVVEGIKHHHERYDGGGIPAGLAGQEIPLTARIIAVADSYDAMTSDRPYRPARPRQEALDEIRRCAGSQFDPVVAEAFLELHRQTPGWVAGGMS